MNIENKQNQEGQNEKKSIEFHLKARLEKPDIYPTRFQVPDDKVDWAVDFPEYSPVRFTAEKVLIEAQKQNGWAESEDISAVKQKREFHSYEDVLNFDKNGLPLNPRGRTGIEGRGLLGKWGANFAADPIVTRLNPQTGLLEMLAIQRNDNGEWAIPGGMVDEGESATETLKREFKEEVGIDLDMSDAVEVYKGYVDDPRNTDNAWMETTARHKHLLSELAERLNPEAGSDAKDFQWLALNKESMSTLYASHSDLIRKAIKSFYDREKDNLSTIMRQQLEEILLIN
ncbi:MAG: NUDIX domain-containing protein [Minisyncoccia bacterium]